MLSFVKDGKLRAGMYRNIGRKDWLRSKSSSVRYLAEMDCQRISIFHLTETSLFGKVVRCAQMAVPFIVARWRQQS